MGTLKPDREARLRALYADACADVLRFAQRRVHPSHAEDVTADAFVVAWRRDDAPDRPDDLRAWLFGIARHRPLNSNRGQGGRVLRTDGNPVMTARTDSTLRSLDAADATLTASEQERAAATLERIVATAPSTGHQQPAAPTPARGSRRRLVLVPTAALTLIVGSVVVQGAGGSNPAYAS